MHFPASWQTLAKETPADIPLLSCSSIVKFCCLRNKSALYDLGAGLYAVQSVENHACRCGPEGRDRPPDLITQAVLNAIESTGLRGAGGVRVGPAGQELLQAEELRGPELHDGPLATSGRACRFANSGRACKSCRDCVRVPPTWAPCQVRTCLQIVQRLLCRRAALQAAPVLSVPAGPTPGQSLLSSSSSSSSSSDAGPTRAIGCWTDSPARTARRPSTRAVSHSCSRLLGSCWTAVTPAAAALQAAPAHSVPAGPTAPPGQLAAQLALVESRQNSSRPRPCSQQHPRPHLVPAGPTAPPGQLAAQTPGQSLTPAAALQDPCFLQLD